MNGPVFSDPGCTNMTSVGSSNPTGFPPPGKSATSTMALMSSSKHGLLVAIALVLGALMQLV